MNEDVGATAASSRASAAEFRHHWGLWCALGLGVLAAVLTARHMRRQEGELFEAEFGQRTLERALAIKRELNVCRENVEDLAALFDTFGDVGRDAFHTFTSTILAKDSGTRALGYNSMVRASDRAAFEAWARGVVDPGFRITERTTEGLVAASERPSHVVVTFIEPHAGNEEAIGYDVASEPVRARAFELAADTGKAAMTAGLNLVQDAPTRPGVLLCVPIYSGVPESGAERRAGIRAFAVGVLRIDSIVEKALEGLEPIGSHLRVMDETEGPEATPLYVEDSRDPDDPDSRESRPRAGADFAVATHTFEIAGRRWRVESTPTEEYRARSRSWTPTAVLLLGLFGGLLGVAYLISSQAARRRLDRMTRARRQADERQADFGRVLDESHDELYVFDAASLRFLHVNRGARENLGYDPEELARMTPLDLEPEHTPESFAALVQPLRDGARPRVEYRTAHRRRDGSRYDVHAHLQLATFDGVKAFTAVVLDVTESLQVEERLRQKQRIEALGVLAGGTAHEFQQHPHPDPGQRGPRAGASLSG